MNVFDKGGAGYLMERDLYALKKKYFDPPEEITEDYWNSFMADIQSFIRKHKALDESYVKGMTVPIIRRVERIGAERRDQRRNVEKYD